MSLFWLLLDDKCDNLTTKFGVARRRSVSEGNRNKGQFVLCSSIEVMELRFKLFLMKKKHGKTWQFASTKVDGFSLYETNASGWVFIMFINIYVLYFDGENFV